MNIKKIVIILAALFPCVANTMENNLFEFDEKKDLEAIELIDLFLKNQGEMDELSKAKEEVDYLTPIIATSKLATELGLRDIQNRLNAITQPHRTTSIQPVASLCHLPPAPSWPHWTDPINPMNFMSFITPAVSLHVQPQPHSAHFPIEPRAKKIKKSNAPVLECIHYQCKKTFDTIEQKRNHEESGHKTFPCYWCDDAPRFKYARALKWHYQQEHLHKENDPIPKEVIAHTK